MKVNLLIFSILLGVFVSNNVLAKPYSSILPAQFPVKKILITVSSQPTSGNADIYHVSLKGDGNSFLVKNNEKQPLKISTDTLIELLNDFYSVHFFEIPDTFHIKKKAVLKDNGIVTTIVNKELAATDSKKVCVQLREYKKCVSVIDKQPAGISQIVNKIETLIESAGR